MFQRKHQNKAERKRFATLYLGVAAFGIYIAGLTFVEYGLSDLFLIPVLAIIGTVLYVYREHTFPFRLRCRETGERLTWEEILYDDSNLSEKAKQAREEREDQNATDSED